MLPTDHIDHKLGYIWLKWHQKICQAVQLDSAAEYWYISVAEITEIVHVVRRDFAADLLNYSHFRKFISKDHLGSKIGWSTHMFHAIQFLNMQNECWLVDSQSLKHYSTLEIAALKQDLSSKVARKIHHCQCWKIVIFENPAYPDILNQKIVPSTDKLTDFYHS